jgi:hypothetical protein
MKQTPTTRSIQRRLGDEDLGALVRAMRNDERSWPYIARKLRERTDVDFTVEALRQWFADEPELAGRAA